MKQAYHKILNKFVMVLENDSGSHHVYDSDGIYLGRCWKDNLVFDMKETLIK